MRSPPAAAARAVGGVPLCTTEHAAACSDQLGVSPRAVSALRSGSRGRRAACLRWGRVGRCCERGCPPPRTADALEEWSQFTSTRPAA